MIVCLCKGIGSSTIRAVVRSGATTVDEVAEACGAGSDCGSCQESIAELIDDALADGRRRVSLPLALTG